MAGLTEADGEALNLSLDAMQLDSPSQISLKDLPDDLLALILRFIIDVDDVGWGNGGMNVLRLVSKRLMRVVESCATRLTQLSINGPESFPLALRRCKVVENIRCDSFNLKSLKIDGRSLESLEPLRACIKLELLDIGWAPHTADFSPLASSTGLKKITLHSIEISDLSALRSMSMLENLNINYCRNIKSLAFLSSMTHLKVLWCYEIDPWTTLLPLASCVGLKELRCNGGALDLEELRKRLPGLQIN